MIFFAGEIKLIIAATGMILDIIFRFGKEVCKYYILNSRIEKADVVFFPNV